MAEYDYQLGTRLASALGWEVSADWPSQQIARIPGGGLVHMGWLCSEWSGMGVLIEQLLWLGYALHVRPAPDRAALVDLSLQSQGESWHAESVPWREAPLALAKLAVQALEARAEREGRDTTQQVVERCHRAAREALSALQEGQLGSGFDASAVAPFFGASDDETMAEREYVVLDARHYRHALYLLARAD